MTDTDDCERFCLRATLVLTCALCVAGCRTPGETAHVEQPVNPPSAPVSEMTPDETAITQASLNARTKQLDELRRTIVQSPETALEEATPSSDIQLASYQVPTLPPVEGVEDAPAQEEVSPTGPAETPPLPAENDILNRPRMKLSIPELPAPKRQEDRYPFLFVDPLGSKPVEDGMLATTNVRPVSLDDCIAFALEHNPDILVSRYDVPSAAEQVQLQKSAFDPVLKMGAQWSRIDQQVVSVIEGNGIGTGGIATDTFGAPQGLVEQIALEKQLDTGGFFQTGWETTYSFTEPAGSFLSLNPSLRSRLNFRFEHPLFKGAGEDVATTGLRVARATHRGSIHDFKATVNQIIRDVCLAYWDLYNVQANVKANEQFVKEARVTWQKEVAKRQLGSSSLPDIAAAREQYERYRQELVRARRLFLLSERALRQVLGMRSTEGKYLVPSTAPTAEFADVDWETALSEALSLRPEVASKWEAVRSAEITHEATENGLEPDVAAFANYSLSGVGDKFDDSARTVLNNRFQDWTLGFRYERPFGRRLDNAAERTAAILLMQARADHRSIQHTVEHELRTAYDKLTTTAGLVETLENQLAAAKVQTEANKVLYEQGHISLDFFLRTQTAYAEALRQKEQVFVEYSQALAEWEFARGTIMSTADVTVSEPVIPH